MTSADRDHLRTLSICHYVLGGVCFIVGCFPLLHLAIGIAMVGSVFGQPQQAQGAAPFPAELFGWFFIVIAATVIVP